MAAKKYFWVYMLTNKHNRVIYTGFSSDLITRVQQHKAKTYPGFTKKYNIDKLVWYQTFEAAMPAIEREKQIKAGSRKKKIELIESMNPEWRDLYDDLI